MATPVSAPTLAPITRNAAALAAQNDVSRLHFTMTTILKIKGDVDPAAVTEDDYKNDHMIAALADTGVDNWSEFLALGPEDIQTLVVPALDPADGSGRIAEHDLPRLWKHKLRALLAWYHFESRKLTRPIDLTKTVPAHFDNFRTTDYCPTEAIIP